MTQNSSATKRPASALASKRSKDELATRAGTTSLTSRMPWTTEAARHAGAILKTPKIFLENNLATW